MFSKTTEDNFSNQKRYAYEVKRSLCNTKEIEPKKEPLPKNDQNTIHAE